MSAIDWDREFEEPWRSIGKAFIDDVAAIMNGETIIPLEKDRAAIRLSGLTHQEIAERAGVSRSFVGAMSRGETPIHSPWAERVRNVLSGELLR